MLINACHTGRKLVITLLNFIECISSDVDLAPFQL